MMNNSTDILVRSVKATPLPASFGNDLMVYGVNLWLFTTFAYVAAYVAWTMGSAIVRHRQWDKWNHPVTLHRLAWFCGSLAMTMRCGMDAATLWAWNPKDPVTYAAVITAKRFTDPLAICLAAIWLAILVMSSAAMEQQLRKQPFPVKMWARMPSLIQPLLITVLAGCMALGVVWTRG